MGESDDTRLARAMEANWEALAHYLAGHFGGSVEDTPLGFRFRTGLHSGFMNGVLRTDARPEDVSDLVGATRAWFPAGLPWRWVVGPTSRPGDLADRLEARGLERRWPSMPAMAVDLDGLEDRSWTPRDGRVTEVLTRDDLAAWLGVRRANLHLDDATMAAWARAHGETPFGPGSALRHFVGWLGERPVAGASVFRGAGVAGIYHVDTLEAARGRGFGKAVTQAALTTARNEGDRLGVLNASALGLPAYRRLGFRVVGDFTTLVGGAH